MRQEMSDCFGWEFAIFQIYGVDSRCIRLQCGRSKPIALRGVKFPEGRAPKQVKDFPQIDAEIGIFVRIRNGHIL